ncbi:hypothetical protein Ddc_15588 [Ditylenchus destructor]|nr:hypothetical protein Ddc_15588 [Ditylenchus destructor]
MIRLTLFFALILIQCTNAFLSPTIPNFLPYLPRSLGNWIDSEPETRTVDTYQEDMDSSEDPIENSPDAIWDLNILPPSVWSNLLTSVRTEIPKTKKIREESYPVMMPGLQTRHLGYGHDYRRAHLSFGKRYLERQDEATVQKQREKTTKRSMGKNPLCYFTALPCSLY